VRQQGVAGFAETFRALREELADLYCASGPFDIERAAALQRALRKTVCAYRGYMDITNHKTAIEAIRIARLVLDEQRKALERMRDHAQHGEVARVALQFLAELDK